MAHHCIACLMAVVVAFTMAFPAVAQTQTAGTPQTTETDIMGGITETLEGFTKAAPELVEAQGRDKATRGEFGGAETGEEPSFLGGAAGETARGATAGLQQRRLPSGTYRRAAQPGQAGAPVVRPRLVVGFPYKPRVSPAIGQDVQVCLQRIPDFGATSSIRATVRGNVVILEGTVANRHQALLAVQMAALEPGVVTVANRLSVANAAPPAPSAGQ